MAQETVVEYETVEKERTVTVCDECARKEIDDIDWTFDENGEI